MTSKEQLQRIPATMDSLFDLQEIIYGLGEIGRPTPFGTFIQFATRSDEVVRIYDNSKLKDEEEPDLEKRISIFIHNKRDVLTHTTIYRFNPAEYTIQKSEIIEPNGPTTIGEIVDNLNELAEAVDNGKWYSFIQRHNDLLIRMEKYQKSARLEEKVGLSFVSEAELQELIEKLQAFIP